MENHELYISLALSLLAICISAISLWVTQKQIYSGIVGQNRIDHSKEIRNIVLHFIELYLVEAPKNELITTKAHLDLCLNIRSQDSHSELSVLLQKYVDTHNLAVEDIVIAATRVLQERWERTKLELAMLPHRKKTIKDRIDSFNQKAK